MNLLFHKIFFIFYNYLTLYLLSKNDCLRLAHVEINKLDVDILNHKEDPQLIHSLLLFCNMCVLNQTINSSKLKNIV